MSVLLQALPPTLQAGGTVMCLQPIATVAVEAAKQLRRDAEVLPAVTHAVPARTSYLKYGRRKKLLGRGSIGVAT
jgi:hypothetical protein